MPFVRNGIIPQALPALASDTLRCFAIDVRAASVVGVVGAGGIRTGALAWGG